MHLALPPSLQYREAYVIGDVQVDELALIAPGVLLYAEPGCQIQIGPGVCIGMGCVIHARGGDLEIGAGTSLGTGVLLWGAGKIGSQTCVGANSTLINPELGSTAVVAPASLLGDASRQVTVTATATVTVEKTAIEKTSVAVTAELPVEALPIEDLPEKVSLEVEQVTTNPPEANPPATHPPAASRGVVGKDYVQQMMGKMFPGQANLNGSG